MLRAQTDVGTRPRAGRRALRLLSAAVLLILLVHSPVSALAQLDYVFLRETLEVERESLRSLLKPYIRSTEVQEFPSEAPGEVFRIYLEKALQILKAESDEPELHAALVGFDGRLDPNDEVQCQALGVMLGDYLQVRYGDDLTRELKQLVAMETYNSIKEPNPENLEFHKAFRYLEALAEGLGLQAQNHDFEVLEIKLPAAGAAASEAPLAIYSHIDVMRPGSHPVEDDPKPYELQWNDGRWAGRGVYSDKGPTLINLFALRVMRDANLQLARPVVLLIASEANQFGASVGQAIERCSTPPGLVLSADGVFPYATGEKGNLLARISSTRGMKSRQGIQPGTFYIHKIECTSSTNTVPAETRVWVKYSNPEGSLNPSGDMVTRWRAVKEPYAEANPATRFGTYVQEDTLHFFAFGLPTHCESKGRNSIMDAAAVLTQHELYKNSAWDVVQFIHEVFQQDPTGRTTALWFEHPTMGGTHVQPVQFDRIGDEVSVYIDIRWPPGHDREWIRQRMQETVDRFNNQHGTRLSLDWEEGGHEPMEVQPPAGVAGLLVQAYELASGDFEPPPAPVVYASSRQLPDAIPFGPEWPDTEKRGQTRGESISLREISDLGVAYLAALSWLSTSALPTSR